jgi:hypothetical protein
MPPSLSRIMTREAVLPSARWSEGSSGQCICRFCGCRSTRRGYAQNACLRSVDCAAKARQFPTPALWKLSEGFEHIFASKRRHSELRLGHISRINFRPGQSRGQSPCFVSLLICPRNLVLHWIMFISIINVIVTGWQMVIMIRGSNLFGKTFPAIEHR